MGDLATDARPAFDALHARALSLREAMAASSNPLSVLTGEVLDELHELASKAQDETMARLDAFQGAANHMLRHWILVLML